ncbi:MAG: 50S ribosomal protein L10 [Actinomycetota bacterium]|nr:50S ribosomal protein L10 [Actinomycetota bacterium]
MAKQEKIDKVGELKEAFKNSHGLIFTDHSGLKAEDAVKVRNKLVEVNSYLKIIKNTLALIAAKDVFKDLDLEEILKGPTSIVISGEDMISTSRVLENFSKDLELLKIKAGIFENRLLSSEEIEKFASLPGREVLLTNLAITIKSPIIMLVNVLSTLTSNLVLVLSAIKDIKSKAN